MNLPRLIRRVTARRSRRTTWAAIAVLLLAGLPIGAIPAAGQDPATISPGDPAELAPDVSLLVAGPIEEPERLAAELGDLDGVARATIDVTATDPLVHLALTGAGSDSRPVEVVVSRARRTIQQAEPGLSVAAGGSAIVDRSLVDRFARSAGWIMWLAAAIGLAIGLLDGRADRWRRGLIAAVALALAVLAATSIGSQIAGPFRGTMAGTALPAALGGLVVATALAVRLMIWFRAPSGTDGAAQIQGAVTDLGPEYVLVFSGLFATSLIVEPLDPGRSAITVATMGAAVAGVVTMAVLAPALALVGQPHRRPDDPLPDDGQANRNRPIERLPFSVPDGRHLSFPVVALASLALAILAVAAFGRVEIDLLDGSSLGEDDEAAAVAAAQAVQGGDPTEGFVVTGGQATDADLAGWVSVAAERSDVAWIDFDGQRYTSTGPTVLEDWASLAPSGTGTAVIVPTTSLRGGEGPTLIDGLETIPLAGDGLRFEGRGSEIGDLAGSRGTVLLAIALLGLASGVAALVLTGNRALAVVSTLLRLLIGGATVGMHNLVASDPSMASILTTLTAVGLGSLISEVELLRRLENESESVAPGRTGRLRSPVPGPGHANAGQFGAIGTATLVPAAVVLAAVAAFGGGPGTVRLAVALLLGAIVDIGVGAAVLRPALLGQRSAFQTAARPLRIMVHGRSTGDPDAETPPDDDPAWREVVTDLIQTEFWLQTEPKGAELGLVFEPDTPVHRQASERHANLVQTGLRVIGQPPELRSLRTVRDSQPVIVTVAVDHPASQLLDQDGNVVGVRRPERRIGRLWLGADPIRGHRIAESIELGSSALPDISSNGSPGAGSADETVDVERQMVEDPSG